MNKNLAHLLIGFVLLLIVGCNSDVAPTATATPEPTLSTNVLSKSTPTPITTATPDPTAEMQTRVAEAVEGTLEAENAMAETRTWALIPTVTAFFEEVDATSTTEASESFGSEFEIVVLVSGGYPDEDVEAILDEWGNIQPDVNFVYERVNCSDERLAEVNDILFLVNETVEVSCSMSFADNIDYIYPLSQTDITEVRNKLGLDQ